MFGVQDSIPLEPVWKKFLEGVAGVAPPMITAQQYDEVIGATGPDNIADVERKLRAAGRTTASLRLQQDDVCLSNSAIEVRSLPLALVRACLPLVLGACVLGNLPARREGSASHPSAPPVQYMCPDAC
jgi:hypothetical protein